MAAPAHDLANFVDAILNLCRRSGAHRDAQGIRLRAEIFPVCGQRKDDPVVQRSAKRRPFLFPNADHRARKIIPANLSANRIDSRHQVVHNVHANHTRGRRALQVGVGNVAAFDEVHIVKLGHFRSPRAKIRVLQ